MKPAAPTPVVRYAEGLSTPESVLYDEGGDRYLVSNINGKPGDVDNNGFISELSPEGGVSKPKFIAGGVAKVKLDAPKGTRHRGGFALRLRHQRRAQDSTSRPAHRKPPSRSRARPSSMTSRWGATGRSTFLTRA